MKNWKTVVKWFLMLSFITWIVSALIVTFAPYFAMCFGLALAACQTGSPWFILIAQWIPSLLLVIITAPVWIDYLNLKHEQKERRKAENERLDKEEADEENVSK